MTRLLRFTFLAALMALAIPAATQAHFLLMAPTSWLVENERGDPQKLAPCGGTSANAGTPSGVVGTATGGSKLHIKLMETIFHPGHYYVALAATRAALPENPPVVTRDTEKGPWSVSSPIQSTPKAPFLADGLFVHTAKPTEPYETDVELPNINCEKCVLQVVQFMAEHGYNKDGGYFYHHCADLQITADPAKPLDTTWTR